MADSSFTVTGSGGGGSVSIGGAVTGGTNGSVLFISPAGILDEDNPNFYWDNTNKRLGIGTNVPTNQLHIVGTGLLTDIVSRWEYAANPVTTIRNDGTQNWFLTGVGRIAIASPTAQPGLVMFDEFDLGRSDLRRLDGGGLDFAAHALGTIAPVRIRMGATGEVLIKSLIGLFDAATERLDVDGNIVVRQRGEFIWRDTAGGEFVAFRAPAVVTTSVTYDLPPSDGTAGQVLTTSGAGVLTWTTVIGGGGITSLNGLVAAVQTFATGTAGTDFAISSAVSTHTFNLPIASAVNTGKLSNTDWTTFNNKFTLPALTAGSVLFSDGSTIAQDNANFFWDDTNNRLGLGTTTPNQQLELTGNLRLVASTSTAGIIYSGVNTYIHNFGTDNFFAGVQAGNLTMTGNENVGIGFDALNNLTTGSNNVVIGSDAGDALTTSSNNVAIGRNALGAATAAGGGGNTAVGSFALLSADSSSNTAIGSSVLLVATGNANTVVGSGCATSLTTGSNNLMIGTAGQQFPSNTADDQIVIGNIIFATGANSIGTTITGNVGIAVTSPLAKLHVNQATLGSAVQQLSSTATNDDPAEVVTQGRVATTDATVTTIQTIVIPASTTVAIESIVIARRTGGASGTAEDGARYKISAVYKNVAGTATIIGSVTRTIDEDVPAYNATFTLSGGNVLISVNGPATTNVTWHSTTRTYSVSS